MKKCFDKQLYGIEDRSCCHLFNLAKAYKEFLN